MKKLNPFLLGGAILCLAMYLAWQYASENTSPAKPALKTQTERVIPKASLSDAGRKPTTVTGRVSVTVGDKVVAQPIEQ